MPRRRTRTPREELDFDDAPPTALVQSLEQVEAEVRASLVMPAVETAQESLMRIAQDAVLILRRELAFRAAMSERMPGLLTVFDINALLRTMTELAPLAKQPGEDKEADYSRLTPAERAQLATLLLKVDCQ